MTDETIDTDNISLATELTIAWLSNPNTRAGAEDVPAFLRSMHDAVATLSGTVASDAAPVEDSSYEGAVTARKSLASPDYIISMIDGKPYKALRRHLSTNGLTPEEYRARYNLKPDYPMVAPAYSEQRRAMAVKIGLGSNRRKAAVEAPDPAKAPRKPRTPKPAVAAPEG